MKKIISLVVTFLLASNLAFANKMDKVISNVNKNVISVSVKDCQTGKIIYEHNSKKPMQPASTLKVVTYAAVLDELGLNYEFLTSLYKDTENKLILKLGADPFLTGQDLKNIFKTAKAKNIVSPKAISIDDTIIDNIEWGEGWQWDDDLNPLMPKFSAYNIDGNLLKAVIEPTVKGAPADIKLSVFYPVTFMNLVTSDTQNFPIKLTRNNSISPDIIKIEGQVAGRKEITFPVNYPKRYFMLRLEDAIKNNKIYYYNDFPLTKLSQKNIYLVDKISNPITKATEAVLKDSNNMVAETVFKIAGGHYAKNTGSIENATLMLDKYLCKLVLTTTDIKIVDGSGVSKNNIVTSDFMTSFLVAQNNFDENYKNYLASAGEGTLKNRMLYFGDKIKAKTGTLSNVSAITGYLTTSSNNLLAFNIMITDAKTQNSEKKTIEEYILRELYLRY